jgi:hypothetical protein
MIMKKFLFISFIIYFYTGCTIPTQNIETDEEEFSCMKEAKPKSLLYIEQQFRCRSYQ